MNLGIVLEVAIGLVLMYLVLSLFVTAINEFIAQLGGVRARHLESALRKMLNLRLDADDKKNLDLFEAIKKSPTFQIAGAISKTRWSGVDPRPSYLKRENFIAALREAIPQVPGAPAGVTSASELAKLIDALPANSAIKSALDAAISDVKGQAAEVEQRIGNWYDAMMERATGAYKRWMSAFSLLLGLALAVAFNCDTIAVAEKLAKSPELRAKVVVAAEKVIERCVDAKKPTTGTDKKTTLDEGGPSNSQNNSSAASSQVDCKDVRQNLDALQALPMGWTKTKDYQPFDSYKDWSNGLASVVVWFNKSWEWGFVSFIGWLLTAFAVSLGAPFWFDLLSKFMNVRSSFRKKEA